MDRGDYLVEFDEIPERFRARLVETPDECWVPSVKHLSASPTAVVAGVKRTLRRLLWLLDGRKIGETQKLTPQCGTPRCHRPEHQDPTLGDGGESADQNAAWRRRGRRYHERMRRQRYSDPAELRMAVASLELRGFKRAEEFRGRLAVMTYHVGRGRNRNHIGVADSGVRWLYWQEPLRLRGSKAAERKAAA